MGKSLYFPVRRIPSIQQIFALLGNRTKSNQNGSKSYRRIVSALTIDDLRSLSQRRVPKAVFNYVDGGADSEKTLKTNTNSLRNYQFRPHVLRPIHNVAINTKILGKEVSAPIVLAPAGFTRMLHPSGEVAAAQASARLGLIHTLSTVGTVSPEDLVKYVPTGRKWFQLYLTKDRSISSDLLMRAKNSGFEALVLTVDTPVGGRKLRDIKSGFSLPPNVSLSSIIDMAQHPRWCLNAISTLPLDLYISEYFRRDGGMSSPRLMDCFKNDNSSINDIEWVRNNWSGPLLVKGVLRNDDAKAIISTGVDGLVVSNHGGRQLDQSIPTIDVLKAIREEVPVDRTLLVDSGFRTGRDVAVAIGLGADAVMIGRAYLYGLMAGGSNGVEHAIKLITSELTQTMSLLGVTKISEISEDFLVRGTP